MEKKYRIKTISKTLLADTLTPVNIYLKLRDAFASSILLESSDYHGKENSLSMICCDPIAGFQLKGSSVDLQFPDGTFSKQEITTGDLIKRLEGFQKSFEAEPTCKLFGYLSYDTVRHFEDVSIAPGQNIPDAVYKLYRYVISVDHFSNQLTIIENFLADTQPKGLESIEQLILSNKFSTYSFQTTKEETSTISDNDFRELVKRGIGHCKKGDVFQIVFSRRFSSDFKGDEFNVYRALRSINPSPYLFYFDYGSFKLFGSSPEAQLRIQNGKASIYPIAGTFKRTGNDLEDAALAKRLAEDEKENAEHNMLVDLARNDISKNASSVKVEVFKEVQFYSHVIHLVSKVTGQLHGNTSNFEMLANTFPAGTLSGAPKHKAMSLISQYEKVSRGFYGGAIGFLGFNGDFNHAIMIRTFLSKKNSLTYQAGAGIVSKSNPENELQEVNNKLAALRNAVRMAQTI